MKRLSIYLFIVALFAANATALPKIIRVPQDQPTVQAGINAALNGDTVLVAEGTYSVNLLLAKKIVLASLYIIDGDTSHISRTILDGATPRNPDSASVILVKTGTDSTTVISGFTIRHGGGTRIYDVSYAMYWRGGGGILILGGGARISHNVITDGTMSSSGLVWGGGIAMTPVEGPLAYWIIEHNQITNNVLTSTNPPGAEGGGAALQNRGRFNHNLVAHNVANASKDGFGGGIVIYGDIDSTIIEVSDNLIHGNDAILWGGGIGAALPNNPLAFLSVTLTNNILNGNSAGVFGGAMHLQSGTYKIINNTIAGNFGPQAIEGESMHGPLTMLFLNNIIWDPDCQTEIRYTPTTPSYPRNIEVSYCDVRGGGGLPGTGSINADPLFLSSNPDSLGWFKYNSPCANAGSESATVGGVLLTAPTRDYYGHVRPFGSKPDIGAFEDGPWSGIEEAGDVMPAAFALEQNYPNPFNPTTTVSFQLPVASDVRLVVYDILGREAAVLVHERKAPGRYEVTFDAAGLASGMYVYRVTAGNFSQTRTMLLLK